MWLSADKDCLSGMPHCHYCIICVTSAALTVPTPCPIIEYWYVQTLPRKTAMEKCPGWGYVEENWGIRQKFAFSKILTSFVLVLFMSGCLQFAILCHLKTPKMSQNNWSVEQEQADCLEKLSERESESTALLMHFTIFKIRAYLYRYRWKLDVL